MPKVSVIIPTYDSAHCIQRAIQSVQSQTFKDMEIIVIDDGSTDNTEAIVRSISDERIRCIRCETNRGAGAARNEGLKVARGKYIAFLDSDDEWLPEKLEKQVNLMEVLPLDYGISYSGSISCWDGSKRQDIACRADKKYSGDVYKAWLLSRFACATPAVMIKRDCISKVGLFEEQLKRMQDADYWTRIFKVYKCAVIEEPLVKIHLQLHRKVLEGAEEAILLYLVIRMKELSELGWYIRRKVTSRAMWNIFCLMIYAGQYSKGLYYLLKSFILMPTCPLRLCLARVGQYIKRVCSSE